MSSSLELDQEDIGARLETDSFCEDISVLVQRRGVTESDIDSALSTLLSKDDKIGACIIVLMPSLVVSNGDAPGPEYKIRHAVQVIEQPLLSQDETSGVGKSAELIAEMTRKILHFFAARGGVLTFAGMEPVPVDPGKISYNVFFLQRCSDYSYQRCGLPLISPDEGQAPQSVALTTATAGASIYYTTDGSYPSAANPAATLYSAPVSIEEGVTLRAAAQKSGLQQSNVAEATFAPPEE